MIHYSSTQPVQGDTLETLLRKLSQLLGATPSALDNEYESLWKIVESVSNARNEALLNPAPGDPKYALARKLLQLVGTIP